MVRGESSCRLLCFVIAPLSFHHLVNRADDVVVRIWSAGLALHLSVFCRFHSVRFPRGERSSEEG